MGDTSSSVILQMPTVRNCSQFFYFGIVHGGEISVKKKQSVCKPGSVLCAEAQSVCHLSTLTVTSKL